MPRPRRAVRARHRDRRSWPTLAAVALHEAAHAVTALRAGRGLVDVSIDRDDVSDGAITLYSLRRSAPTRSALAEIVTTLAGMVAEQIATDTEVIPDGAEDDLSQALTWIARTPGAHLPEWLHVTKRLVRKSWHDVEVVAGVLIDERWLSAHDVKLLIAA